MRKTIKCGGWAILFYKAEFEKKGNFLVFWNWRMVLGLQKARPKTRFIYSYT
jgi:hypothetical protein